MKRTFTTCGSYYRYTTFAQIFYEKKWDAGVLPAEETRKNNGNATVSVAEKNATQKNSSSSLEKVPKVEE